MFCCFFLNTSLRRALEAEELDLGQITTLLAEAQRDHIPLATARLRSAFQPSHQRLLERLSAAPADALLQQKLQATMAFLHTFPFTVDL